MQSETETLPDRGRGEDKTALLNDTAANRILGAEERFRLLIDSVTDCGITMLDETGRVATWNTGAQRIHGYDAQDVIGHPFAVLFLPEDVSAQVPERILQDATRMGRSEENCWRMRKDGSRFRANVVITSMRDSDGVLRGFAVLARDLTQLNGANDAVKDSEARLRSILDTVPDAIVIVDDLGLIESFSPAATRIFGYSLEEVIGQNVKMLMPVLYRDHRDGLSRFREIGEKQIAGADRAVIGVRRDGTSFPMELAVAEAMGGKRRLFTGFVRDLTERRRVESELNEAKGVAEAANLAKSDFLSSMSHELRTPLNAILGFAQLMQSDVPPPTLDQTASIDQILQAGWYLLALINEVLDLSLIESGKLTLSPEPIAISEILSDCEAMMAPLAQKRGVTMSFPVFEAPCYVLADRTRLRQVFVNLLSNAIKYNRVNGTVMVTCNSHAPGHVRIHVTDTGMGLSPEKILQLYQPFNRLGQEVGVEQGTGIGLVVTKRIVEAMHGTIGVESTLDVGTMFWVDLKAADAIDCDLTQSGAPCVPDICEIAAPPARTVLYVEDNPANLKLVEMLVARRADLKLLCAGTGDLGIELARAHLPDVILMDINLPGISGIKALAVLRREAATAHIPIIALSANASPRDIERGLTAGFFKYLTKPIKVDELMATLDLALTDAPQPLLARAG